jgi:hypothetical protein
VLPAAARESRLLWEVFVRLAAGSPRVSLGISFRANHKKKKKKEARSVPFIAFHSVTCRSSCHVTSFSSLGGQRTMTWVAVVAALALVSTASALPYGKNSKVIQLSDKNFAQEVMGRFVIFLSLTHPNLPAFVSLTCSPARSVSARTRGWWSSTPLGVATAKVSNPHTRRLPTNLTVS